MLPVLSYVVLALSGAGFVWSLVLIAISHPLDVTTLADRGILGIAAALEGALLVQLVAGIVLFIGTDRPVTGITFVGYLIGSLLILPIGVVWSMVERSRWGPGVLGVAFLTIPILILRLNTIWNVGA